MRTSEPKDRALIDLRDRRTDLAIRISLLKDGDKPDEQFNYSLDCSATWSFLIVASPLIGVRPIFRFPFQRCRFQEWLASRFTS